MQHGVRAHDKKIPRMRVVSCLARAFASWIPKSVLSIVIGSPHSGAENMGGVVLHRARRRKERTRPRRRAGGFNGRVGKKGEIERKFERGLGLKGRGEVK